MMSGFEKKGRTILSYHDSLITEDDVKLLDGPYWLNDTIISFYLEYLEKEKYVGVDVCFIGPEVTQCLKLSEISDFPIFLDPLDFKNKALTFMPINDCENTISPGGSHWSLLVYSKQERTFYHVDSCNGSNERPAKELYHKLTQYVKGNPPCDFKTLKSLQQTNSYDCGVFVLCNIDNILSNVLRNKKIEEASPIHEFEVLKKRKDIKDLIENLAEFYSKKSRSVS